MKVKLLKPTLFNDQMYGPDSVVEMEDEGRAKYFIGMNQAEETTDEYTEPPPVVQPIRSPQADQIGEAVGAAIVKAVSGKSKKDS